MDGPFVPWEEGENRSAAIRGRLTYAVSLTAAILNWLTITDKRTMLIVSREGFIDWPWSSAPLLKSGNYYAGRQKVVELPAASLAARQVNLDTGRHGVLHAPGVWPGFEPVREMTVFSPSKDMAISLRLYPDSPSRWEMAGLDDDPTADAYDRFMSGRAN